MISFRNRVIAAAFSVATLLLAWSLVSPATRWWQLYNWETNFDDALEKAGIIRLNELLSFDCECIYFLRAFEFTLPIQQQIYPMHAPFLPTTWGSPGFIYIVYSRLNAPPFIARLRSDRFVFSRDRNAKICSSDASLAVLQADDQRCPGGQSARICIAPVQSSGSQGLEVPR